MMDQQILNSDDQRNGGYRHTELIPAIKLKHFWLMSVLVLLLTPSVRGSEPTFSRTAKFKIPFLYDQSELTKLGATEIQLYVSDDQGTSWRLHDTVKPSAGSFTYVAPADGEYWFSVRTLAMGGLTYPSGMHQAGLKVVVDTMAPDLLLELTEINSGILELEWKALDQHIKSETLKIEWLDSKNNSWEKLEFVPSPVGKTTWTVSTAGLVEVRGSVQDSSGNSKETTTQTIIAGPATPMNGKVERARPIAKETETQPAIASNQPIEVVKPIRSDQSRTIVIGSPKETPQEAAPAAQPVMTQKAPPEEKALSKADSEILPRLKSIPNATTPEGDKPATKPLVITNPHVREFPKRSPSAEDESTAKQAGSTSSPSKAAGEPVAPKPVQPQKPPQLSRQHPSSTNRLGHLVNSKTFRIGYEVDDVGPSGISRIELYITENGGQNWFHYGSDDDRISPMVVTVPKEGEYGFSFRIRNGIGLTATPPQPTEKPDINVTVDQTPPSAELLPIQPPREMNSQKVLLEWKANDRELDLNPIALYYATQATGPWELIEGWRPHSGKLEWEVPQELTGNIYLRLDVRDAAGNITRIDGEKPYSIDTSIPKARITDIESLKVQ